MTFVNVGYWAPNITMLPASASLDATLTLQTTNGIGFTLSNLFGFILDQFKKIGFNFHNGTLGVQQLDTQKICVDDVCIDKVQFKALIQNSGVTPLMSTTPTPDATPTLPTPSPLETSTGSSISQPSSSSSGEIGTTPTLSDTPAPTPDATLTPEPTP